MAAVLFILLMFINLEPTMLLLLMKMIFTSQNKIITTRTSLANYFCTIAFLLLYFSHIWYGLKSYQSHSVITQE